MNSKYFIKKFRIRNMLQDKFDQQGKQQRLTARIMH